MKTSPVKFSILIVLLLIHVTSLYAAIKNKPITKNEILGYSIGVNLANSISKQHLAGNKIKMSEGFSDGLLGHPLLINKETMQKSLLIYQQTLQLQQQTNLAKKFWTNRQALLHPQFSPISGNKRGKITLIEFYDYQCVHCRRMQGIVDSLIKNDPQLRVIFKVFPIFGNNSTFAAKAALAARMQNKFWKFHNQLLTSSKPLTHHEVLTLAKMVGINIAQLRKDMLTPAIRKEIKNNHALAIKLAIYGTPGFIISPTQLSKSNKHNVGIPVFIPGEVSLAQMEQIIQHVQKQIPGQSGFIFKKNKVKTLAENHSVWPGI